MTRVEKKAAREELAVKILAHISSSPACTMGQIAKAILTESKLLRPVLIALRKNTKLTSTGEKRSTRYTVSA